MSRPLFPTAALDMACQTVASKHTPTHVHTCMFPTTMTSSNSNKRIRCEATNSSRLVALPRAWQTAVATWLEIDDLHSMQQCCKTLYAAVTPRVASSALLWMVTGMPIGTSDKSAWMFKKRDLAMKRFQDSLRIVTPAGNLFAMMQKISASGDIARETAVIVDAAFQLRPLFDELFQARWICSTRHGGQAATHACCWKCATAFVVAIARREYNAHLRSLFAKCVAPVAKS